jgi:hypothetical protein
MPAEKWLLSTRAVNPATIFTTELNALAAGDGILSSPISNDAAGTELDIWADFELVIDSMPVAPAQGATIELYTVRQIGGTYEDALGGIPANAIYPGGGFAGAFQLTARTSDQRMIVPKVIVPPGDFEVMIRNRSGQALGASGHTLKVFFYQRQITS